MRQAKTFHNVPSTGEHRFKHDLNPLDLTFLVLLVSVLGAKQGSGSCPLLCARGVIIEFLLRLSRPVKSNFVTGVELLVVLKDGGVKGGLRFNFQV